MGVFVKCIYAEVETSDVNGRSCVLGSAVDHTRNALIERFVKELKTSDLENPQLGLAHSCSRAKVKLDVNVVDNMVIQAIFLLDTLDIYVNFFSNESYICFSTQFMYL